MTETRERPRPRERPHKQAHKHPAPTDTNVNAGIEVQHRQNGQVVNEDKQEFPGQFPTTEPYARVGLACSVTQNMGNYNSVKVSAWLEMPCKPTDTHVEETRVGISRLLDRWIEEELDLATGERQ